MISLLANQTDIVRGKQALASAEYEKGASPVGEFAAERTKQAEEALDIERRNNALILDQFERRAGELRTAAGEEVKILAIDAQGAKKRRLIQAKLQQELVALELGNHAYRWR